jgi:hypothetical protein
MRKPGWLIVLLTILFFISPIYPAHARSHDFDSDEFADRMPQHISPPGEKLILVNPRVHAWGAYDSDGSLVRGGIATSGANWCPDLHRRCHTKSGTFRIYSLGSADCISHKFPIPRGGAPMPYCMFFNGGQGLHGSYEIGDANLSHGCVRLQVEDAEWIRYDFVEGPNSQNDFRGTKVIVESY